MNQLTNDGTFTYTYDLVGNLSTKSKGAGLEKWYYAYNQNNQLLSVRKTSDGTTNTMTVTYAYDAFGNRVKQDEWVSGGSTTTTKFVFVGDQVYLDLTSGNALQERYIRGDNANELIARIDGSNNEAWYLTDRLGSVRDIINNSGTDLDSVTYSAYGAITTQTNGTNLGNYAWQGMGYDPNSVLYYTHYRPTYDPLIGRYYNIDPTLQEGGTNFYGDVGNDPTNETDPSGLEPIIVPGSAHQIITQVIATQGAFPASPLGAVAQVGLAATAAEHPALTLIAVDWAFFRLKGITTNPDPKEVEEMQARFIAAMREVSEPIAKNRNATIKLDRASYAVVVELLSDPDYRTNRELATLAGRAPEEFAAALQAYLRPSARPKQPTPEQARQIEQLVKELGNEDFDKREAATEKLIQMNGKDQVIYDVLVEQLRLAVDPEIRDRLNRILAASVSEREDLLMAELIRALPTLLRGQGIDIRKLVEKVASGNLAHYRTRAAIIVYIDPNTPR
jgi:RHS repeat-associated protein